MFKKKYTVYFVSYWKIRNKTVSYFWEEGTNLYKEKVSLFKLIKTFILGEFIPVSGKYNGENCRFVIHKIVKQGKRL